MKLPAVLLIGSLICNGVLAVVLFQRPQPAVTSTSASSPTTASGTAARPTMAGMADRAGPETWSELTKDSVPSAIAQLRAGGMPNRYLRAVAQALIAERNADRHRAIVEAIAAKPWWQGQAYEPVLSDAKITAMRRQLELDERTQTFELLGSNSPQSAYDRAWAERKYGGLPPERMEQVSRINREYSDLMAEVRAQGRDIILDEDREKLAFLERERVADLAKALSPDELFEFTLRSSGTANRLRNQLVAFDPSEEEFRAMFKLHQAVDARYADGRVQNLTQEQRRERNDAIKALDAQIAGVLTPERFAEYQLKTDADYIQTSGFVTRLGLPSATTATVMTVQKDIAGRLAAITADRSLTQEQRAGQFATLANEANGRLTTALGEKGLATYRQSSGAWLAVLEQRARSAKK